MLLVNMTDESGAPRHECEASHDLDRHSRIGQHCGEGAGRVDRDVILLRRVERGAQTLEGSDVRMTHDVSVSGSAHSSVPVDPLCP